MNFKLLFGKRNKSKRLQRIIPKVYVENKEIARDLAIVRLNYFNKFYGFTWNRIAIKNTKRRWGSCSKKGNLNFCYKIVFLPSELSDYVIVHELCHLGQFNHSRNFWELVAKTMPNYRIIRKRLMNESGKFL